MHPRISVNGISTFGCTLDQDIALCRSLGVGWLGLVPDKVADDPGGAAAGLVASGVKPSCMVAALSEATAAAVRGDGDEAVAAVLLPMIDAAAALSCPLVYMISGGVPSRTPTDLAIATLARALQGPRAYAAARGVSLAVENNSPATRRLGFVNTLRDAALLAEAAGIGITVELQACWYEGDLAGQFRRNADRIALVQVSDFALSERLNFNRVVPGDGDAPLEWMIARLLEAGYRGLFDIEVIGPAIESEGQEAAVRRSVEWLAEVLVRLGA